MKDTNNHNHSHIPRIDNETPDLVCFSHLRWDFVFQRPQHIMSRFADGRRVFFIEEPIIGDARLSSEDGIAIDISEPIPNLIRCVPRLTNRSQGDFDVRLVRSLSDQYGISNPILWFYTPMMLEWARPLLPASAVVYDCMDELSKFRFAPPELLAKEEELLEAADIVFTGGRSLYEAKRGRHANVHAFPSSIDVEHFQRAREGAPDPPDQATHSRPRIGYAGVIDERLDLGLLDEVAALRPDANFVMLGPVVKIDEATLPRRENILYLGQKAYADLPAYFANWDIGMMPFALNESTEFISPTKTPEYLAAGLPVISTPIRDVVDPYGSNGLVEIIGSASEMAIAIDKLLTTSHDTARVDQFLEGNSWDRTCREMLDLTEPITSSFRNESAGDIGEPAEYRHLTAR